MKNIQGEIEYAIDREVFVPARNAKGDKVLLVDPKGVYQIWDDISNIQTDIVESVHTSLIAS